jgi:hypothetical protein
MHGILEKSMSLFSFAETCSSIRNKAMADMKVNGFSLFVYHTLEGLRCEIGKGFTDFDEAALVARKRWLTEEKTQAE